MGKAIEVNDNNFGELVKGDKPVLVDFWAEWCTPCTVMRPEVEKVAENLAGKVTFFSLDTENKDLREVLLTQEIEGIPSLVFYKGGKQLDRLAGYKKADVLEKLIREVIK